MQNIVSFEIFQLKMPLEIDCGITEYVNTENEGFTCILKHRYEDFVVREIAAKGENGLRLVSTAAIKDKSEEVAEKCPADFETISKFRPDLDKIFEKNEGTFEIPCENMDKEWRTKIHKSIRICYEGKLTSTTVSDSNKIRIETCTEKKEARKRKYWPSSRDGEFCHFTLAKANLDTHQALAVLCRYLKIEPKRFGTAGTKDRRAVTFQKASVFKIDAGTLSKLNESLKGIGIGDFSYEKRHIKLGDLYGNRFALVLRNVQEDEAAIRDAISDWKNNGFVNYYGCQRFGTTSVSTALIGRELLKENWEGVVNSILKPREDADELNKALKSYEAEKDARKAWNLVAQNKFLTIEAKLLNSLKKQANVNYFQALKELSRNQLSLYVHAYQSFVWNTVVSEKIATFGKNVCVGDLLLKNDGDEAPIIAESDEGEFTELVLPLPYTDAVFPENEVKSSILKILVKDGLKLEDFSRKQKDFALGISYRKLFEKPVDVNFEFLTYSNPNLALIETEITEKIGKVVPESSGENAVKRALKLEFTLPSGSYATVALRELTKMDLSRNAQFSLSKTEEESWQKSS